MSKIEFNQTFLQAKKYKKVILKRVSNVIDSGIFLNGKEAKRLDKKLENFFGNGYFVTTASGHDSLMLAFKYFNLSSNDEIIFPANSYPTAFPVFLSGAKGIAVDVDKNGQLDPDELIKNITPKTKIVVVVHLFGLVGALNEIINICKQKKIILIEDCAQAFGTKYKNKYVGTFGDIGCFSFFPTKNIGTLGDGGGIWTKNKKIFDYFIKAKQYGEKERFYSEFLSGHSRLPEIQASVLNLYLETFSKDSYKKKILYSYFKKQLLKNKLLTQNVNILDSNKYSDPQIHLFVVRVKKRNDLIKYLGKNNIPSYVRYPFLINTMPAFNFLRKRNFVNTQRLTKESLCLPFHQFLSKKNIRYIVNTISKFYSL